MRRTSGASRPTSHSKKVREHTASLQKTPAEWRVFESVEKHSFSNSLSIETTLSIEFAIPNRALRAQLGIVLYKNCDTCSQFLWKLRFTAISYLMRAAARRTFSKSKKHPPYGGCFAVCMCAGRSYSAPSAFASAISFSGRRPQKCTSYRCMQSSMTLTASSRVSAAEVVVCLCSRPLYTSKKCVISLA